MKLKLIIGLLLLTTSAFGQLSTEKIDALLTDALNKFKVAGASIAIVKDGKILHQKGYGVTSVETKIPVDAATNFQIASNTKAFTTTALALLQEEGKLKWTDKVVDYIPEFKMYNDYVTQNFTIQDLVTHRSGLGLGAGDLMIFPDGSDFTLQDVVKNFQYMKPTSAFRTKFDYDNLLYIVAGEVIARRSGKTYEAFIQERILTPLEMSKTYVGAQPKEADNVAYPHSSITGAPHRIEYGSFGFGSAAGGIFSNVSDMSKWMITQLNHGKYGKDLVNTLFTKESQAEMWRLHTVIETNPNPRYNSHFNGYGLGWFLTDKKGYLEVSHTGGFPGMLSQVKLYPDLNLGIVVLTNTENGGAGLFSAVTNAIADSYLGLDDFSWVDKISERMNKNNANSDEVTKKVWEKVEAEKKTKINKQNFVGTYNDPWFGNIEVSEKNGQLWMRCVRSPKLNGQMFYYNANTFAVKWEYTAMPCDAFALFTLDENGLATGFKMKGISPIMDFSFDFQDLDLTRVVKK